MSKLVEIVIRWYCHEIGFNTDIKKMYDSLQLKEEHWCFQQYIWHYDLDKRKLPDEKVIKTLIYGVKSRGNQSERGLCETARISADEYPEVNDIAQKVYMLMTVCQVNKISTRPLKEQINLNWVLNIGGLSLKDITFSGKDSPIALSADDSSINVAGMKWFPREDLLPFDISELTFAKKDIVCQR